MEKENKQFQRALDYRYSAERICACCKKQLFGRIDKRYCDYTCKNQFHSVMRAYRREVNKEVNASLDRNYQVMMEVMGPEEKGVFNRTELQRKGFDFSSCTSYKRNAFGIMNYVYNYYWFARTNNKIELRLDPKAQPLPEMVLRRWMADLRARGII